MDFGGLVCCCIFKNLFRNMRSSNVIGLSLGIDDLQDQIENLNIELENENRLDVRESLMEDIEDLKNQLNSLMNMQEW